MDVITKLRLKFETNSSLAVLTPDEYLDDVKEILKDLKVEAGTVIKGTQLYKDVAKVFKMSNNSLLTIKSTDKESTRKLLNQKIYAEKLVGVVILDQS